MKQYMQDDGGQVRYVAELHAATVEVLAGPRAHSCPTRMATCYVGTVALGARYAAVC